MSLSIKTPTSTPSHHILIALASASEDLDLALTVTSITQSGVMVRVKGFEDELVDELVDVLESALPDYLIMRKDGHVLCRARVMSED